MKRWSASLLAVLAAATLEVAPAFAKGHGGIHVKPRHLKPGEQLQVSGAFAAPAYEEGEEVVLAECTDLSSAGAPLECGTNSVVTTVNGMGRFSATITAARCPYSDEAPHPNRCYIGVVRSSGEDSFLLALHVTITVK